MNINEIVHPDYVNMSSDWQKYRLTYAGGQPFITEYLKMFSARETHRDFSDRQSMAYNPAHAKAALVDVKNAIYQRMIDIVRAGGSPSYMQAVKGEGKGVDLLGNSMSGFIGRLVLPDLLSMGKVGVYIDRPEMDLVETKDRTAGRRPYIYKYSTEDIRNWMVNSENQLTDVLLRDSVEVVDEEYGFVTGYEYNYRSLSLTSNGVSVKIYNDAGERIKSVLLGLTEIPFVVFEISSSLLVDVANYQIALLNMSSSDLNYIIKSNFPFYTEQYDIMAEMSDLRASDSVSGSGSESEAEKAGDKNIKVGVTKGRRYPRGVDRPQFIAPPTDPLVASMSKQGQMREEIRQLVNLSVTNTSSKASSAESKQMDEHSLEAGLSNIGLELEYGERQIAEIWDSYLRYTGDLVVKYPNNYSIKTDADRRSEAKELREELPTIPSKTYQKELAKQITTIVMGNKVTDEKLAVIHSEIDESSVVVTSPDVIQSDHESGFVSTKLASTLRGYPEDEADKAKADHAERLARIAVAQSEASRGNPDADTGEVTKKEEKAGSRNTDKDDKVTDKTRGEGA